jgi:crotonobetainyl-CoA:carnitine CoA-transferase CaiB-like acyl-CoA transferase
MSADKSRSQAPPYTGLRVIELADQPGAEYTGRLLAEMGAEVIKLEPTEGAASRRIGPFAGGVDDGEHSLHFWFYNADKRSVTLDLTSSGGARALQELQHYLSTADVFICGLQPSQLQAAGISLQTVAALNPRLIIAAITPFGLTGPWKDLKSSDLVSLAAGGPLHMCGYDDHSIPPIRPGGNQGFHTGTAFAHIGILLALLERQGSGKGQIVDLSNHEALAVTVELANPYWFYPRALVLRQTCRHAQPVRTQPALFKCADGYVYFALVITEEKPWQVLVKWLKGHGLESGLDDAAFLDAAYRQANFDKIQQVVEVFFLVNSAEQMYREGQENGLPIGKLNAPEDLFQDQHLKDRGFFHSVSHPGLGEVAYPGAPYTFSGFSAVAPGPAPRLDDGALAHNAQRSKQ